MPWPPSAEYLKNLEDVIPEELERFLKIVLSGEGETENVRVNRLVLLIGQDICRGAQAHTDMPDIEAYVPKQGIAHTFKQVWAL